MLAAVVGLFLIQQKAAQHIKLLLFLSEEQLLRGTLSIHVLAGWPGGWLRDKKTPPTHKSASLQHDEKRCTDVYVCVASATQCGTRPTRRGGTDVNNCSLYLTTPPLHSLSLSVYEANSQSRANIAELQLCSTNWILEVSMPCSWMNRIKCGNLKLGIFLMLPTDSPKHKLPCGLMKYISLPQNDFGWSKTQNESWKSKLVSPVEKSLNTPCLPRH